MRISDWSFRRVLFRSIAREGFATAEARTAYYAGIDIAVNVLTLVVQLLLTRLLMSRYGLLAVLMIPMACLLVGFAVLTASPLPIVVGIVQVVTRDRKSTRLNSSH